MEKCSCLIRIVNGKEINTAWKFSVMSFLSSASIYQCHADSFAEYNLAANII